MSSLFGSIWSAITDVSISSKTVFIKTFSSSSKAKDTFESAVNKDVGDNLYKVEKNIRNTADKTWKLVEDLEPQ